MKLIMYAYGDQVKLYDEDTKKVIVENADFEYIDGYTSALHVYNIYDRKNVKVIQISPQDKIFTDLNFYDDNEY